jgi:hypothetical protein
MTSENITCDSCLDAKSQNSNSDYETCSICMCEISDEPKVLPCSHIIHENCYNALIKSKISKKCPLCRENIIPDIDKCRICKEVVSMKEEDCDTIRSLDCGCYFHFDCLMNERRKKGGFYCDHCDVVSSGDNIEPLSFSYFKNGYLKWVGEKVDCKNYRCFNKGNPQRRGYCNAHGRNYEASNCAVILAFSYILRFVNNPVNERANIFLEILSYMDTNHRLHRLHQVDLARIRDILNIDNVIHY